MALQTDRRGWAQRLTSLIVIGAFGNSYRHGFEWAKHWSPKDQSDVWAGSIAALPEAMIIWCVLMFPYNRWTWRTWVPGSLAVGWTLWANGSSARTGVSGLFIALAPALVSLIMFSGAHSAEPASETQRSQPEPAQKPVSRPRPKRVSRSRDDSPEPPEPAHAPEVSLRPGRLTVAPEPALKPRERGLKWAADHGRPEPSIADLKAPEPDGPGLSHATAKRVRAELLSQKIDSDRESENESDVAV